MKSLFHSREVTSGNGWRINEEVCQAGPTDRPFEEQHSHFAVSAVLAGTFVYRGSRGSALMSAGSLLLGQQGAEFTCSHEHGCGDRCVAFYFDQAWVENLARELPGVRSPQLSQVRIPPAQALARLMADVQALAEGPNLGGGEELAVRMAAAALNYDPSGPPAPRATASDENRIAAVLRNLEEKVSEPLSLSQLAEAIGMSRYHFLRTFHRVTGQTPWQYVVSRRLARAARNLTSQNGSVIEAASAAGFNDISEFNRQFLRHFRMTPKSYRQRQIRSNFPQVSSKSISL